MQAIVLAGGFGTRLRPLVSNVPKVMAPIHGKPFLAYLINYLVTQGITEIVLSVHYLHEQIKGYFNHQYQDTKILYAIEDQPLGTGGAIVHALNHFSTPSKPVFVINGDTFLKLDYKKLMRHHNTHKSHLTIAVKKMIDQCRYGKINIQGDIITQFDAVNESSEGLINAGVYLLNSDLFKSFTLPPQFSFEKDFLLSYAPTLQPIAFMVEDYFIDIGIPQDYLQIINDFKS